MPDPLPETTVARLAAHVPERNLRELQVVTGAPGRWLPVLFRANAVTLRRRVLFRSGHYRPDTKRGLALIAHESLHVEQWRDLGAMRFLYQYLRGLLASGFRRDAHPLERGPIEVQRRLRALFDAEDGGPED
jgi:hypothetical protein